MKRPSKFDGKGRSLAGDVVPFPSPARRGGQTANSFIPGPVASVRDQEGAGVSPASASSTFTPLGDLTHAVVLRLAGGYPRIRVSGQLGGESHPLDDQQEGDR